MNIIAILSNSLKRSKSKSKKQFIIRRPFFRPYPVFFRRTFESPSVYAVVRSVPECPLKKGIRTLIAKTSGVCKSPCNIKTCIQTSMECCVYAKPE